MFPLCSTCADTKNQGNCTQSDEERCKIGTWIVEEFRKAFEMGYALLGLFEFWEYSVTCSDKGTNSGGFFGEYVDKFLNLKQESSGYPSWVQCEEGKDKYIEDNQRTEGIALHNASISKKLRATNLRQAKIKLNMSQMGTEPEKDSHNIN